MGQSGKFFNADGSTTGVWTTNIIKNKLRPIIPASRQHSGTFGDGTILWDWLAFEVPKGSSKLISVTAIIRGTDGAAQGALPIDLVFGRSIDGVPPPSLGTVGAAVTTFNWANNIAGYHSIVAGDYTDADLVTLRVAQSGITTGSKELVLTGEPISGHNVGYDTLYVAALAKAVFDFRGTVQIATARDAAAVASSAALSGVLKTKSAEVNFSAGDVLHDDEDLVLGEIQSIESSTAITYRAGTQDDVHALNRRVYNIHPVSLILGFEL